MPGVTDAGRGRAGRPGVQTPAASLVVLAAFGLGIGPGTAVQPCPKHPLGGSADSAPFARGDSHASTHGSAIHARPPGGGHHGRTAAEPPANGDGPVEGGSHGSHSDGPCDCLGLCHASALEARFADVRVPAVGAVVTLGAVQPIQLVARHPARYLRPFARPPPT